MKSEELSGVKAAESTRRAVGACHARASAPRAPGKPGQGTPRTGAETPAKLEMVAVAAYYLAEHRGFAPGFELEDWVRAEATIEAQLKQSNVSAEAAPTKRRRHAE